MTNNILLFRLYVIFALLFLIPLSFVITQQTYVLIKNYVFILYLLFFSNQKVKNIISKKFYAYIFDFYVIRKQFFVCISLAELSLVFFPQNKFSTYTSLAYCYQKNKFFYVAEYYYLKSLAIMPNDITILNSLIELYKNLRDPDKVSFISKQIKQLSLSGSIH